MFFFPLLLESDADRDKLVEIYQLYKGTMKHIAEGILHDPSLADDAVSEAIIRIMKNLHKISEVNCYQTRGFVVIILRNVSLDLLEKQNRLSEVPLDENIGNTANAFAFNDYSAIEARDMIIDCINKLNNNYSDILYLAAQGYSNSEMGKILGISADNAKMRLSRARSALIKKLREEGFEYA